MPDEDRLAASALVRSRRRDGPVVRGVPLPERGGRRVRPSPSQKGRCCVLKEIVPRFERDETLDRIEVLVRAPERDAQVDALLARISGEEPERLTVTAEDGTRRRLAVADVLTVSVTGNVTRLVTEDASYALRQPLQSLELSLPAGKFVRVSRYELVNVDKILRYDFTLAGTLRLELAGGMETWASRRCIPAIRRHLNGGEAQKA